MEDKVTHSHIPAGILRDLQLTLNTEKRKHLDINIHKSVNMHRSAVSAPQRFKLHKTNHDMCSSLVL